MKVARNTNLHVSSRGADRDRDALKHAGEEQRALDSPSWYTSHEYALSTILVRAVELIAVTHFK